MNLSLPNDEQFHWKDDTLYCEDVSLKALAEQFGTPLYIYSEKAIRKAFERYEHALSSQPHLVCYALKANSNLSIIRLLSRLGAGFDIVSGGELKRVLAAGADPSKVVFSGVGKTAAEIEAALRAGIKCFNVESLPELDRLIEICRRTGQKARVSFRVNPDVDAKTHPYISTGLKKNKFGVAYEEAAAAYEKAAAAPELEVTGIDCHIGSQITEIAPFADACEKICTLLDELSAKGIRLHHIDFGGGLGIRYNDENPPHASELIGKLQSILTARGYPGLEMIFEAGRSVVGNSGALLMKVEYFKKTPLKNFCIVDTGMNDMMRPALYEAWMQIVPVAPRKDRKPELCSVVGPVCETGDWLAQDRRLAVASGDVLAMLSAGAYGMSMSSAYNSRPLCAEVLVSGSKAHLIRRRQSAEDLFRDEILI